MLHAHLTARKLVIRHIRDGVELAPIAQDMNYDFDYQQMREVHPPRRILPGDIVLTECEYNTLGRTNITYVSREGRLIFLRSFIKFRRDVWIDRMRLIF